MSIDYVFYADKDVEELDELAFTLEAKHPELFGRLYAIGRPRAAHDIDLEIAGEFGVRPRVQFLVAVIDKTASEFAEQAMLRAIADRGSLWGPNFLVLKNQEVNVTPGR